MTSDHGGLVRERLAALAVELAVERSLSEGASASATAKDALPHFVLVTGTPASGKTRLRHEKYGHGYVTVDAGDIFRLIPDSDELDFPGEFDWFIDAVGMRVAQRALSEHRHVVTEVFDAGAPQTVELIQSVKALGYHTELVGVRADLERSMEWNSSRGPSNISSYYTDRFNVRWLTDAAREAVRPQDEGRGQTR